MSDLQARFAENIYWLGRYLERAENIARVLHVNETYARDMTAGPSWRKVLDLYADTSRFLSRYSETSPEAVIEFYIRDGSNPTSISFSVACARENARTVRHLISTEMWTQINLFNSSVQRLSKHDTGIANLSRTAVSLITGLQTLTGIAEGTFSQSEPWCFYQLGRFLERTDQTTRILDISYDQLSMSAPDAVATVQWGTLLRSVSGYYAYRSKYPAASKVSDIVSFLLYDTEFPRAVSVGVQRVSERLRDIERRHGNTQSVGLEKKRRELEFALSTGPGQALTSKKLHAFLDRTQALLGALSSEIEATYFGKAAAG